MLKEDLNGHRDNLGQRNHVSEGIGEGREMEDEGGRGEGDREEVERMSGWR